jgi:hypothetical protein
VFPADGFGIFVVEADVAQELSGEVVDGGEDAPGDDVAFDFGEDQFHLIEPRGIGGCEVEMDVGMFCEESADGLVLCAERLSAMTWISLPRGC